MATNPTWDAVRSIHALMSFVPDHADGTSRVLRSVQVMRQLAEKDQYPEAVPFPSMEETAREPFLNPISYPRIEINAAIEAAKPLLLQLAKRAQIERGMRLRLAQEIEKSSPFLGDDDRGTIGGLVDPTGHTQEKARNNGRLDALVLLLEAIRADPGIVLQKIDEILEAARPTMHGWRFDIEGGCIHRGENTYTDILPEAVLFMRMMIERPGIWVSVKDVKRRGDAEKIDVASGKVEELKKALPKVLQALLESERGRGTRLKTS